MEHESNGENIKRGVGELKTWKITFTEGGPQCVEDPYKWPALMIEKTGDDAELIADVGSMEEGHYLLVRCTRERLDVFKNYHNHNNFQKEDHLFSEL